MRAPSSLFRPAVIRFVQWAAVFLSVWNLARAAVLWRQLQWLGTLPLVPEPRFRLIMAVIWAFLFLLSAVALGLGYPRTRFFLPLLIAAYGVYEFGLIALYATEPPAILPILLYGLFTMLVAGALNRPAAKVYFQSNPNRRSPIRAAHESQDRTTSGI